jgi:hypothetical protein
MTDDTQHHHDRDLFGDDGNELFDLNAGVALDATGSLFALPDFATVALANDGVLSLGEVTILNQPLASANVGDPVPGVLEGTFSTVSSIVAFKGNMTIVLDLDSNATRAPVSYINGWRNAATLLASAMEFVKNAVTVDINIEYNEGSFTVGQGGAAAGPQNGKLFPYSTVRTDLINNALPGDTNFSALPVGTSITGTANGSTPQNFNQVEVYPAQAQVLGLAVPSSDTADGTAGFSRGIPGTSVSGVALHELAHAMGRVPGGTNPDIFDFFRFPGGSPTDSFTLLPSSGMGAGDKISLTIGSTTNTYTLTAGDVSSGSQLALDLASAFKGSYVIGGVATSIALTAPHYPVPSSLDIVGGVGATSISPVFAYTDKAGDTATTSSVGLAAPTTTVAGKATHPGTILVSDALPAPTEAFFSVDGGTTEVAAYGVQSDPSDFLDAAILGSQYGNDGASGLTPADLFDQYYFPGVTSQFLSAIDLTQLDVLGFDTVCFAEGTRIQTVRGEVSVELLRSGDQVVTQAGEQRVPRPVKWIGHRRIDLTAHPAPERAAPVRIRRGAIARDVPRRDLLVSPDHAVWLDGVLVLARRLVNGATISQETGARAVRYFHVELDRHAILLAEGLPAESYLDTGNRGFFANADEPTVLHPDLTGDANDWRLAGSCAPLLDEPEAMWRIWKKFADRAVGLGYVVETKNTTSDPDLYLLADGVRVAPSTTGQYRRDFVVPAGATELRLMSRTARPIACRPWLNDRRSLGVPVAGIQSRGGHTTTDVPMDHPALADGWWGVEDDGEATIRWTNGDARLPPLPGSGPWVLEIALARCVMEYPDIDRGPAPAATKPARAA